MTASGVYNEIVSRTTNEAVMFWSIFQLKDHARVGPLLVLAGHLTIG